MVNGDTVIVRPGTYLEKRTYVRQVLDYYDRVLLEHRFVSRSLGESCTSGRSLVVAFDREAGRKAPLPPRVRERLQAHLAVGAGSDAVTTRS